MPKNKARLVRQFYSAVFRQYFAHFGAQYLSFALMLIFATLLGAFVTNYINVGPDWRFQWGQHHRTSLHTTPATEAPAVNLGQIYKVTANDVHLRESPSKNSRSLGKVNRNDRVEVLSTANAQWYRVKAKGREAYIYSRFLTKEQ